MSEDVLAASRQELAAARHLAEGGFPVQAVSRAYYAAFRAAEAALQELGEARSKHAGVISEFGRRLVKEEGLGSETVRLLASLFERRHEADYASGEATPRDAQKAIDDAGTFVDAVAGWLEAQGQA